MSYATEHRRMKPVMDKARELDIATNLNPEAVFEAGSGGFQIWCTPNDHPDGWDGVPMIAGAFSKPCSYVASVGWGWDEDRITHLLVSTMPYDLGDHLDKGRYSLHNRPEDIAWATDKTRWLFQQAHVQMPPVKIQEG